MQSAFDPRVADALSPATSRRPGSGPPAPLSLRDDIADWLNRCLRAELSAVETYDLAAQKVGRGALTDALRQIRASHEGRAALLREHLLAAGRSPSRSSGVWGAFAKAVQTSADVLGDRAVLGALEQFEAHAASIYAERPASIDEATAAMLGVHVLPGQTFTRDLIRSLLSFVQRH